MAEVRVVPVRTRWMQCWDCQNRSSKFPDMTKVTWPSWSATLGLNMDGFVVNAALVPGAASVPLSTTAMSRSRKVLAIGDSGGFLTLARCPAKETAGLGKVYPGAVSRLTCTRWGANDEHVLAISGSSKLIFQCVPRLLLMKEKAWRRNDRHYE